MDKQNAIQDLSYIKKLMSETQQIMDIVWPIYIYWGIYMMLNNIFKLVFSYKLDFIGITFDHSLSPVELSMVILIIGSWGGLFFTAFYILHHRKKMFNQKMFLIGMLGLSFLFVTVMMSVSIDILWFSFSSQDNILIHYLYKNLINGLYYASLFIVFGLVYAREQLWMGYWILVVTIFTVYLGNNQVFTDNNIQTYLQVPFTVILHINVGICFLIAGIMAYRRHRKQLNSEKRRVESDPVSGRDTDRSAHGNGKQDIN